MTCTVEQYMAKIASYIGFHEAGDNITPFGAWFGPGFQGAPWCDMFVSFGGDAVGGADIIGKFAYTPSHANWFKSRGQWGTVPRRGAIAFFDWNPGTGIDHVAVVESIDANGQVVTIDGNFNNQVARNRHPMKYFAGYGYPAYATVADAGTAANDVPPPALSVPPVFNWDGNSFPGADKFRPGVVGPWITLLGQRLVAHGAGLYKVGPSPEWGEADRLSTQKFQQMQGWSGSDADGYPGQETWNRLAAPVVVAPPPPSKPNVSLAALVDSLRRDSAGAQGYKSNEGNSIIVERALGAEGLLAGQYVDGSFGTMSKNAYAAWQRRLGYSGKDADGIPGHDSLARLGNKYGFTVSA